MTDDQLIEAFELVREHSSPLVLPLLLSMERAWATDRELIRLRDVQVRMTDAMLETRLAVVGRSDD